MPDEQTGSARKRFARDLRRIREDREASVTDVHRDTQISTAQIEAFEDGSLFWRESMNTVYLRAFVRAYAEAIDISPDPVLQSLERALDGTYENEAAVEFLGVPPAVAKEPSPSSDESPTESTEPDQVSDSSGSRAPSKEGVGAEEASDTTEPADVDERDSEQTPSAEATGGEEFETADAPEWMEEDPQGDTDVRTSRPGSVRDSSTEGATRRAGVPETPRRLKVRHLWREHRETILVGLVALLVVLGAFAGVTIISDDSSPSSGEQTNSATAGMTSDAGQGTQADTAEAPVRRPRATVSLGDTMYVTVFAEGVVRRMRVRQDDDLRRPYWIEEGEASVFPFTSRIMIRDRLDSVRVYFEGYPYPTTRTDDEGRIVIDRQTAQSIVDTLRGTLVSLSVDPDTIEIRTPPQAGEGE